jgi:hypothetical protein
MLGGWFGPALAGSEVSWTIFMPSVYTLFNTLGTLAKLLFRFGPGLLIVPASAPTGRSRTLKAESSKGTSSVEAGLPDFRALRFDFSGGLGLIQENLSISSSSSTTSIWLLS